MKLAAYVPLLFDRFPDGAFTKASLEHVARPCVKVFPTYPELAGYLSDWWRAQRPAPPALPALSPPTPRRPDPTPEEIAHTCANASKPSWPTCTAPGASPARRQRRSRGTCRRPNSTWLTRCPTEGSAPMVSQPMPPLAGPRRRPPPLSIPMPPNGWRKPPPPVRRPCGFCTRVRTWLVQKVRR